MHNSYYVFNTIRCLFIFLASLGNTIVFGQNRMQNLINDSIFLDPEVRYGRLQNGFTYYIKDNGVPEKEVEFHLIVKAGYNHENEEQREYAHLLEHLGANGTKHFPIFHSYFRGSGKYSNAYTSPNLTAYYVRIPSDNKEGLKAGLLSVRDRAQDILMEKSLIDVQRGAVLGEMRTTDPYQEWLSKNIEKYIEGNTGVNSYIKEDKIRSLKNFDKGALLNYYRDWYRPNLQAAIVVGDVDVDSMEVLVKKMFSDLKNPIHSKDAESKVEEQKICLKGQNQYVTVHDEKRDDFRVYIVSKAPNYKYNPKTKLDYKKMLLQHLYKEIITLRADLVLGQPKFFITDFFAEYRGNQLCGGQLWTNLTKVNLNANDSKEWKRRFIEALKVRKRMHLGITEDELVKGKGNVLKNFSTDRQLKTSTLVKRYINHFVKGQAAPKFGDELNLIVELLKEIDLKTIQEFALDFIDLSKNTDFLFFKGKTNVVSDFEQIRSWVDQVNAIELTPINFTSFKITTLSDIVKIPETNNASLLAKSENIIGVTTLILRNGIKVLLKPTKVNSRAKTYLNIKNFAIDGYRSNRIPIKNKEEYKLANEIPGLIKFIGTSSYSSFELDRFKSSKNIQIGFSLNHNIQEIHAKSPLEELDEVLNLIYLYMTQPRLENDNFKAWKDFRETEFEGYNVRSSSAFYMDKINSIWYSYIPMLSKQDLGNLKRDKILDVYKKWFTDFSGYTFIVTGDFNTDEVAQKLADKLSVFPIKEQLSSVQSVSNFPLKKLNQTIRIKNIDQAFVKLYFPIIAPRDIKTKVMLQLLSKALNDKIKDHLREGCYAPSAGGEWLDPENNIFSFWICFDSELGNEEKLIKMALEQFHNLHGHGIDPTWLKTYVINEKLNYGSRLESFGLFNFWTDYLKERLINGEDIEGDVLKYETMLEHFVHFEAVNVAAKKYLSEEYFQKFVCLPE